MYTLQLTAYTLASYFCHADVCSQVTCQVQVAPEALALMTAGSAPAQRCLEPGSASSHSGSG